MAKRATVKSIETLKHREAKRKNIPTAEVQSLLEQQQHPKKVYYPRNRDLDPQLVWRGKDEQDWSDLVVQAPPLYIQEKVQPKVLIDDLLRATKEHEHESGELTPDLDGMKEDMSEYGARKTFPEMILENLKIAGVQQAHKEDRITFTALTPWPGDLVCADGRYMEGETEKRAAVFIGPEFGTVLRADLVSAAREAGDAGFDVLIACAFNYEAHTTEFNKLGRIPVLKARMNADLHMAEDLKATGKGNLFVIFGEPDIDLIQETDDKLRVKVNGVDVFKPQTGEVISDNADGIACWFIDTDYNEESFFRPPRLFPRRERPLQRAEDNLESGDRPRSLGNFAQRHVTPVRQAEQGPHSREGDQPPRRRGYEGVQGLTMLREGFNHGFAQSDWDAAKAEARQVMIECARSRRMIPYSDLVRQITRIRLQAHDARLSHFLVEIASEEDEQGRGLLTVVVVHKSGDMQPGPGFFELAQSRGRNTSNIVECWVDELKKVFAYWADS